MRDFNFFSTLERTKKSSLTKRNILIAAFAGYIFVIILAYAVTEYVAVDIKKGVMATQHYLNSGDVGKQNDAIQGKQQKVDVLTKYLSVVEASQYKVANTYSLQSSFIEKIDGAVPAGVAFTSVSYSSSTFSAQCTATSKALAADLYKNLYSLGDFENVYVAGISKVSDNPESYSFSISCTIKGGAAK